MSFYIKPQWLAATQALGKPAKITDAYHAENQELSNMPSIGV